ncbi:MAG TPA: 2-oxo acid dehydrogenase subunit E2 [Stellaceae bacterium]|nr:2-oxo acid dehydrogenase subunit E2 [Stellaceae bacterium]
MTFNKQLNARGEIRRFPRLRNLLLDILAEGRRKNIAHIIVEADFTGIRERLQAHRLQTGESISVTSYIAKSFASAVAADRRMQAYRLGSSRLVVFDDVDIAFMIERESEGESLPVFYIVRGAQRKTMRDIHNELQVAKTKPFGADGPLSALELKFLVLPRVLRRLVWFFIRRNPYLFKAVAGTVGLTSFGMHTTGAALGLPITPMSLTLTVGTIEKRLALCDGVVCEREVIHLDVGLDHDIIDGAPTMRFAARLKELLKSGVDELACPAPPPTMPAAVRVGD